jgi:hypothetical protein
MSVERSIVNDLQVGSIARYTVNMVSVPIRVRHPRGVSTIELDPATTSIDDLKVLVFSTTEIPPSEQESQCSSSASRVS